MIEKLQQLEKIARHLEPSPTLRSSWNQQVQAYTDTFLNQIETAITFNENSGKGEGLYDFPIKEEGYAMESLLNIIESEVDRPGLNPASGGHIAYIPGGGVFPTALGDYLADVTNRYAGVFFASPGAVRMENILLRWMCDIIGFPKTALGNLTSGGSIANLIAIATARDFKQIRSSNMERSVIYLTEQVHHSIQKSIRIAGMRDAPLRYIPVDDRFRMDTTALRAAITADREAGLEPFLLIASAGTTDTGAIDPLNELGEIAEKENLWYHVDAAYGGFFILTEEAASMFAGMERSDSVTIDPHKGLFLSYGTGAVLIKNVEALHHTHEYAAGYMQDVIVDQSEPSPANLSPELTKHFRGMRMWLPMQLFGLQPFRAALSEKIWLCRYFYEAIQELGFEVGPYPELSVMIYRYVPQEGDANTFNDRIVRAVRADGRVFLSSTTIKGVFWLRLAVLCFRTHLSTIKTCLQVLKEKVQELEAADVAKQG